MDSEDDAISMQSRVRRPKDTYSLPEITSEFKERYRYDLRTVCKELSWMWGVSSQAGRSMQGTFDWTTRECFVRRHLSTNESWSRHSGVYVSMLGVYLSGHIVRVVAGEMRWDEHGCLLRHIPATVILETDITRIDEAATLDGSKPSPTLSDQDLRDF